MLCVPAYAAGPGVVTGVVRDAHGTPQVGAIVQLIRADYSVAGQAFTDDHGRYALPHVLAGTYGLKATGEMFLPTLRENLHVLASSHLVVNLTLNTLYEAFRWLPVQTRQADEPKDDWTWTLRLSTNRPLLRMLEDGPLVVVNDGAGPALKARVTVRGGAAQFGDGGLHHDFEVEQSRDDSSQVIFRADLSEAQSAAIGSVVGYEQQLAPGRTFMSVATFEDRPEIAGGPNQQGFQAMMLRSAQVMNFMNAVQLEAGTQIEAVHMGSTLVAAMPFASATIHAGPADIAYRMATSPNAQRADQIDQNSSMAPLVAEQNGRLLVEHGLHQELAVEKHTGNLHMRVVAYHDQLDNPIISAGGTLSAADWAAQDVLYDPATALMQVAAQSFEGSGILGEADEKVGDGVWVSMSVASGAALQMGELPVSSTLASGLMSLRPRNSQMYAAAINGKASHGGTEWRASYRWQSADSMTPVAPFNSGLPAPYLSFFVRQPIRYHHVLPQGIEALVDVRNLLAEGYRPFVTRDGSTLYFAQAERCLEGGLSFSF